jgi:hypothetical protein
MAAAHAISIIPGKTGIVLLLARIRFLLLMEFRLWNGKDTDKLKTLPDNMKAACKIAGRQL